MYKRLQPVTIANHGKLFFQPCQDHSFTKGVDHVEVVAAEFAAAALNFPLAFSERDGCVRLVALLSLQAGRNVFVNRQGRWLAEYVPTAFLPYPFVLGDPVGARGARLHVDMDSGMITEADGHPFFGADGKPSAKLKEVVRFLYDVEKSQHVLRKVCATIGNLKLLVPWGDTAGDLGGESGPGTLLRVDEAMLNTLPDGFISLLRQAGALPVIYAHLLSLGHLAKVARLAQHQAASGAQTRKLLADCLSLKSSKDAAFHF
jgi:hypothetical protein